MIIENITLFDKYIKEKLSVDESTEFERRLETDKLFYEEFTSFAAMVEGINEYERERLKYQIKNHSRMVKFKPIKYYLSVAAILLVLLIPSYFIYYNRFLPENIYKKYRIDQKELVNEIGATANANLKEAITDYLGANYNSSLKKLDKLELNNIHNDTVNYFIGACYLELNEHDKALIYFSKLSNSTTNYFAVAKYNMALIYIKQNNYIEAKNELSAIPKHGTVNTVGKKVNLLMREIE